jgi:hypothetical protein
MYSRLEARLEKIKYSGADALATLHYLPCRKIDDKIFIEEPNKDDKIFVEEPNKDDKIFVEEPNKDDKIFVEEPNKKVRDIWKKLNIKMPKIL